MNPSIPISWGELIDKITILEIKAERLSGASARANVRRELDRLSAIAAPAENRHPAIASLKQTLKQINQTLWRIEDDIREKEAQKSFDERFIELARAVYRTNDERGRIKREINTLLNSDIGEEKEYAAY